MDTTNYSCAIEETAGGVVLVLDGSIGGFAVDAFEKDILAACKPEGRARVVLDCTAVKFITSAGLGSLLKAVKLARQKKMELVCRCPANSFFWNTVKKTGMNAYIVHEAR